MQEKNKGKTPLANDKAAGKEAVKPAVPADLAKSVQAAEPPGVVDLDAPEWYLNRELSWLAFNRRVLNESMDDRNPLLERVNFLSSLGSNLDEFFMKRIGGLKQQVGARVKQLSLDGRSPQQQIDECYDVVRELLELKERMERELLDLLAEENIRIVKYSELSERRLQHMAQYFQENIYPLLTPQGMDPAHPSPLSPTCR